MSVLPEPEAVVGENPVEQVRLVPDEPLELISDLMTLDCLAHEEVPEATKQLTDSIRRFGLLQPILVRATPDTSNAFDEDSMHYDIVDGRRRLSVARKLGLVVIPVMIAETELAIADVATLAMNATRTSNPIAEFEAVQRLTARGATIKDISGATGMAQATIKARQGMLRLSDVLIEAFREGRMTASVAEGAAKLPKTLQAELALALVEKDRITAADLHEVRQASTQAAMNAQLSFDDTDLMDVDYGEGPRDLRVEADPVEYGLATELQSIIERLPAQYLEMKATLREISQSLMAIALGSGISVEEPDGPQGETYYAKYAYVDKDGNEHEVPYDVPPEEPETIFTVNRIDERRVADMRIEHAINEATIPDDDEDDFLNKVFK